MRHITFIMLITVLFIAQVSAFAEAEAKTERPEETSELVGLNGSLMLALGGYRLMPAFPGDRNNGTPIRYRNEKVRKEIAALAPTGFYPNIELKGVLKTDKSGEQVFEVVSVDKPPKSGQPQVGLYEVRLTRKTKDFSTNPLTAISKQLEAKMNSKDMKFPINDFREDPKTGVQEYSYLVRTIYSRSYLERLLSDITLSDGATLEVGYYHPE